MIGFGRCTRGEKTCLHRLAAGDINPADLCHVCTGRFILGTEWAAGESLDWHVEYLARGVEP